MGLKMIECISNSVRNPTRKSRQGFLNDKFVRELYEIFLAKSDKRDCFQRAVENKSYGCVY